MLKLAKTIENISIEPKHKKDTSALNKLDVLTTAPMDLTIPPNKDQALKAPRQPPPIPPKNIYSKYTDANKTNTTPDNMGPASQGASNQSRAAMDNGPKVEQRSKMDHIKRHKKPKPHKMTEMEARKILETMVTPGDPHDKYDLREKLGSGAAGEVFLAIDKTNGNQVAIKRMFLEKQQRKDMIITEIQGIGGVGRLMKIFMIDFVKLTASFFGI